MQVWRDYPNQCRINNSSRCSNCYGPRAFGGPAVFCNKSYLLHYKIVFSLRSQYFAKFATSRKRSFSIERCLRPEILVWFFLYSYVTKGIRLRSAGQGCQFRFFQARFWNSGFVWTPLAFFGNKKNPDKICLFFSLTGLALAKHCLSCIFITNLFWRESVTMQGVRNIAMILLLP